MDEESESARRTDVSLESINGRTVDTEIAGSKPDVSPAEFFLRRIGELAERRRSWRSWRLRSPERRAENRLNNEFMAVFSHELRNYLGSIRSAAYLLHSQTSASPTAEKAHLRIERQIGQMTRLVEDILDVSRIQNGKLTLWCERTDLCAVVAYSVQTVEFMLQQHDHRLITSIPDTPVWVRADPARLQQVFVNLLGNAVKYTDAGGDIELSVQQGAHEVLVRVRDTGLGIAPDVLPHVFDLFMQADSSSRRADAGLGIGLALVRSLVERHGGRVTAASAGLRRGSEFTVYLPMPVGR
jgi:two-component system CheB/CheR fusion protein